MLLAVASVLVFASQYQKYVEYFRVMEEQVGFWLKLHAPPRQQHMQAGGFDDLSCIKEGMSTYELEGIKAASQLVVQESCDE